MGEHTLVSSANPVLTNLRESQMTRMQKIVL